VPFVCVTTKFASEVQVSEIVRPAASNCETVVIAIGASATEQPFEVAVINVPVTTGAVVSFIVMVCVFVVEFPQISVIVYVLIKEIGQIPDVELSVCVTTKFVFKVQASEIVRPAASNCETVVIAVGASATEQPFDEAAIKVPVTIGAVVSFIVMFCVFVVELPQISVIVYVLIKVSGHEPIDRPSKLVTTKFASEIQLSVIVNPAVSNCNTVVIAAGTEITEQPLIAKSVNTPVTTGAKVSLMLIVCVAVVALLHASVMVYVLVNEIGQVPVAVPSELVTTKFASVVQLSEIVKPAASNAATVVKATGASVTEQPLAFTVDNVPVTTGKVVSFMLMV